MIRRNKYNIKNKTVVSPYIYKYNTRCKYRRGRSIGTFKKTEDRPDKSFGFNPQENKEK